MKTVEIDYDSRKFHTCAEGRMPQLEKWDNGYFGGIWEVFEQDVIYNELKEDWNFVDIGANFGQFGFLASPRCKKVYCFEPHPEVFGVLWKNKCDNMEIYNVALGSEERQTTMKTGVGWGGGRVDVGDIPVPIRRLDSYDIVPHMIKMDVEGFGVNVINGADLSECRVIYGEIHGGEGEIPNILREQGFAVNSPFQHCYIGRK